MLLLGLVQSLFSALVFGLKRPVHPSNRILSFWFLIFSLFFLGVLLPRGLVAYIKIGFIPFFLVTGPVFYFYVRSLIAIDFKFRWVHLIHLLPFALMSVLRVIYFPESVSAASFSGGDQIGFIIIILVLASSILAYWVATLILLIRHQRNILNFFSNKSGKRSLNWVLLLMLVALVSHILFFSVPL